MRHAILSSVIVVAFLLAPGAARAATIEYDVSNLGGSLWQYDYYFSGAIDAFEGFAIDFGFDASNLQLEPPATPGWDPLVLDPDTVLGSLGLYDAQALVDNPLFTGPFSVSFVWAGVTAPGQQTFGLYALNASGQPVVFQTGVTTRRDLAVPEPATLLLLAIGLTAARIRKYRRDSLLS